MPEEFIVRARETKNGVIKFQSSRNVVHTGVAVLQMFFSAVKLHEPMYSRRCITSNPVDDIEGMDHRVAVRNDPTRFDHRRQYVE